MKEEVEPSTLGASPLKEVAGFFLRLGFTAFGGPAAHIALMEDETVRRRRWLDREAFLDLLSACNLLPGPSSTQMAMCLGLQRAGWMGLLLGGVCFILPAMLLTLALAWAYVRFGHVPQTQGLLYGIKPVILAVVAQALWSLGRTAFRSRAAVLVGLAAFTGALLGLHPLILLVASGSMVWLLRARSRDASQALGTGLVLAGTSTSISAGAIFLAFLKFGVVVFGSGYVLLAFLKADLVDRWHWLSQAQLLDAIAVGQITPGPVFTTATFIGFLLGGVPGAAAGTLGIFLPSFLMVGAVGKLVPRLRRSAAARAFLDGLNAAAVALMAAVSVQLARSAFVDPWTLGLGLLSAALLFRFRPNPTWLVLGGAAAGTLLAVFVHHPGGLP